MQEKLTALVGIEQKPLEITLKFSREGMWSADWVIGDLGIGVHSSAYPKPHTREQALALLPEWVRSEVRLFR